MEDPGEARSEDDKVSPEKNNMKRKLKTPAQVMALEKCYNEHKYPKEDIKAWLSQETGLTEQQVSGWFCHRRSKDKRLGDDGNANGRQDRSSGVVQDRGSRMPQDSCGSTKQGHCRNGDPREVESQMLFDHDPPVASRTYEHTSGYSGKVSVADIRPSDTDSSSQDSLSSQRRGTYDTETSGYRMPNGAVTQNMKNAGGYKPSGYLKVKGEIENAAIIAVKKQLGRHYMEDGPPLGIEFQPLPPRAFELPCRNPISVPFFVGDRVPGFPEVALGLQNRPSLDSDGKFHRQLKQKSNSRSRSNSIPDQNDSAGEISVYDSSNTQRMKSKYDFDEKRSGAHNRHDRRSGKSTIVQSESWIDGCDDADRMVVQRNESLYVPSSMKSGFGKIHDRENREPPSRTEKMKHSGERKAVKENHNPYRVKMNPEKEMMAGKRNRAKLLPTDQAAMTSNGNYWDREMQIEGVPLLTKHISCRSELEPPSSFDDDETGNTSSSSD